MSALFKKKEKATEAKAKTVTTDAVAVTTETRAQGKNGGLDLTMILVRPHITEKATDLSEKGVYAFEIHKDANKMQVRQAVEKLFKVKPVKVAVVNGKNKYAKNPRTGRVQVKKTGVRKALVYLKSGDKIEFV